MCVADPQFPEVDERVPAIAMIAIASNKNSMEVKSPEFAVLSKNHAKAIRLAHEIVGLTGEPRRSGFPTKLVG